MATSHTWQALGGVIRANLVAPEFEITTSPTILGFLNGATSLVRGLVERGVDAATAVAGRAGAFDGPLHLATRAGHAATARALLEAADVRVADAEREAWDARAAQQRLTIP